MMSSLYSSCTGMKSLSVGMSSIGNNLSNTNTVGFKSAMMLYQDLTSTDVSSASGNYSNGVAGGISQLGHGVSVLSNRIMFGQGGFETGTDPMDMGVSGIGFFGVQKDGVLEFTRAGNFRFTKDGDLVDPSGFNLMGSKIVNGVASGSVEPIKLDLSDKGQTWMAPKATGSVSFIENLGSTQDLSTGTNPYFSMATKWDGTSSPPLGAGSYSHATQITVYDANGTPQALTAYYDYVGSENGNAIYEYVIAQDPSSDAARTGKAGAGLLAAGTMTFSSTGEMTDMTMFDAPSGDHSDLSAWKPSSFGADGNPVLQAAFGSGSQPISVDFGIKLGGSWSHGYASADAVAADPSALYSGTPKELAAVHSTSYSGSSVNMSSKQDGYAEGFLRNLEVTRDGYVRASYSNNQSQDIFRVPLYRFTSQDNLRHEGGNHFSAPAEAGSIEQGYPGEENFGSVYGQHLEQSNVDMAKEFTNLIITQRGFQMNSKVVTTSDAMLQKALELKRQ
ncbi:flagellar hook-basal body complex protein [Desulfovibrio sp. OttesenSCG-928-I05]|nr:flagellar hook-basal body complex protein [Desulfovibrio sp. OttesenSCG-928-I05]